MKQYIEAVLEKLVSDLIQEYSFLKEVEDEYGEVTFGTVIDFSEYIKYNGSIEDYDFNEVYDSTAKLFDIDKIKKICHKKIISKYVDIVFENKSNKPMQVTFAEYIHKISKGCEYCGYNSGFTGESICYGSLLRYSINDGFLPYNTAVLCDHCLNRYHNGNTQSQLR